MSNPYRGKEPLESCPVFCEWCGEPLENTIPSKVCSYDPETGRADLWRLVKRCPSAYRKQFLWNVREWRHDQVMYFLNSDSRVVAYNYERPIDEY